VVVVLVAFVWGFVVMPMLVRMVMILALERGAAGLEHATGRGRELEQRLRHHQLLFGLLDGRVLLRGGGLVLETDDFHPRRIQLHGEAGPFERDVERAAAMLVCASLAMLGAGHARGGHHSTGRGDDGRESCPHAHAQVLLARSLPTAPLPASLRPSGTAPP